MIVAVLFTKDSGDPATGLTLAEIDVYLYRRAKADGTTETLWNAEHPAEEIGGGVYTRMYSGEDMNTYDYFAWAHYTGATSLDSDYSLHDSVAVGPGDIADAVLDEPLAEHDTEDSFGNVVNDLTEESDGTYRFTALALAQTPLNVGSGAITFVYTLTSSVDGAAIADAEVWVTTDQAGENVIANGRTDADGQVTFYLDAGTYYIWRQKAGWNFSNPDTEVVS